MKKIMLTAATNAEIAEFENFLIHHFEHLSASIFRNQHFEIHLVISGVGMMQTSFKIMQSFQGQQFDAAIQAGIAGAYDAQMQLGDLCIVSSEQYGDLGAEDQGAYIDIFELGFSQPDDFPFEKGRLINHQPFELKHSLPRVSSLSVNTVGGQTDTIRQRKMRYGCQIENMEGIAFHYACLQLGIPFVQIRAISNYVQPRDRSAWQIGKAITHLNQYLIQSFQTQA